MKDFLKITFESWGNIIGMWGILCIICTAIYKIIKMIGGIFSFCFRRVTRMLMVRKQGWPPEHLDADGDLKKEQVIIKDIHVG